MVTTDKKYDNVHSPAGVLCVFSARFLFFGVHNQQQKNFPNLWISLGKNSFFFGAHLVRFVLTKHDCYSKFVHKTNISVLGISIYVVVMNSRIYLGGRGKH